MTALALRVFHDNTSVPGFLGAREVENKAYSYSNHTNHRPGAYIYECCTIHKTLSLLGSIIS